MPPQATSKRLIRALSRYAPQLALFLFAASVLARYGAGKLIHIPTIYHDEWFYLEMARSLGAGNLFNWGSFQTNFPCWIYPGMLAWPVAQLDYDHAIRAIRWMNALTISSTVLLSYGFALGVTGRVRALAAAFLVALLPSLIYSGTVMTENVYVPLFVLAMWLAFRAIERPTAANRLLAGIAAALPLHAKPQGLIVPLIFILSVSIFESRRLCADRGPLRPRLVDFARALSLHWLTALGFALGYAPRILEIVLFEHPHQPFQLRYLMGFYYNMGFQGSGFSARLFFPALIANFIGWVVACGVLPAFALGRVLLSSFHPSPFTLRSSSKVRLLAIMTAVAALGQILLNARHITLSNEPPVIYERYFMAMLPMVLIAFSAVAGLVPRSRAGIRSGLAVIAAVIVMFATTQYPIRANLSSDTPSLSGIMVLYSEPWSRSESWIPLLWIAAGIAAVASLFVSNGRLNRSIAAIALLFLFMNFGAYSFEGKAIAPANRDLQQFAREIARTIGPGGRLVIWGDGLDNNQLLQLGFRNPGRLLFIQPNRGNHWMADKFKTDPSGRIASPFPTGRSWLAAADSKKFNKPPVLQIKATKSRAGINVYAMDGLRVGDSALQKK